MAINDTKDFLKNENTLTDQYVRDFLNENNIFSLNKEKQIVEVAKLISKFPWGEARTIEELLITKKFGTCTAKHSLLERCYNLLDIKCHQVVSTFRWSEQGIQYPIELQKILKEGEWDHGHNFIQIEKDNGVKIDVDVTWNSKLKEFGFMTLPDDWDSNSSFLGLKIRQRWDDVDMKTKKIELIESLSSEQRERRSHFLELFVKWIHSINQL